MYYLRLQDREVKNTSPVLHIQWYPSIKGVFSDQANAGQTPFWRLATGNALTFSCPEVVMAERAQEIVIPNPDSSNWGVFPFAPSYLFRQSLKHGYEPIKIFLTKYRAGRLKASEWYLAVLMAKRNGVQKHKFCNQVFSVAIAPQTNSFVDNMLLETAVKKAIMERPPSKHRQYAKYQRVQRGDIDPIVLPNWVPGMR